MQRATTLCTLVLLILVPTSNSGATFRRKIACKTTSNASSCYWTHGRLAFYNGTPAYRLWKIGTHRLLGIYSGPSVDRENSLDNEGPEFPQNVEAILPPPFEGAVFGDFEVCPLEPEEPGVMQAACIESAKNLALGKYPEVQHHSGRQNVLP
jgi:hypothetical protein